MRKHRRPGTVLLAFALVVLCLAGQATPAASAPSDAAPLGKAAPGSFGKSSPANGATGVAVAVTLGWGSSADATAYEFCYDTTNDNNCNAGSWTSTGAATSKTVSGLAASTPYYWQVRASNASGTTYADGSTWWSFTTTATPPNDAIAGATVIGALPYTATQSVAGATTFPTDPIFTCPSPSQRYRTVWFRYTAPSAQTLFLDTMGSNYDTVLAVWTGTPLGLLACNDDSQGRFQSTVEAVLNPGMTYYIEVASYEPAPSSTRLVLNAELSAIPSDFAKQLPTDEATDLGLAATLTWEQAEHSTSYQYCYDTLDNGSCDTGWRNTGGIAVVVTGLSYNTTYYWQVQAKSVLGTTYANSGAWWSFATVAGAPPNDDFGAATEVSAYPFTTAQVAAGATTAVDDPIFPCPSGQRYRTVWFRYTSPSAQTLLIDTAGSNYDTVLGVWTGPRGSLTSVACNDQYGGTSQSRVEFAAAAGTTYYIEVASYSLSGPAGSHLVLTLGAPGAFGKVGPATGATGFGPTVSLSWGTAAAASSYDYCYDTTNDGGCGGTWISTGTSISSQLSGLDPGTTYWWQVRADNSLGITNADGSTWWSFTTAPQATQQMTFRSKPYYDGWVLEQDELSGTGGTRNPAATTARIGDDASDRQYRSILHFDTSSLPDSAVIVSVVLSVKKQGFTGTNPMTTHGNLLVDAKTGSFGNSPQLQTKDFQAAASGAKVGRFLKNTNSGWYRATLKEAVYPLISLTATTQFRLRFATDDNDDAGADYLSFYTGNATTADRPTLVITYYVP